MNLINAKCNYSMQSSVIVFINVRTYMNVYHTCTTPFLFSEPQTVHTYAHVMMYTPLLVSWYNVVRCLIGLDACHVYTCMCGAEQIFLESWALQNLFFLLCCLSFFATPPSAPYCLCMPAASCHVHGSVNHVTMPFLIIYLFGTKQNRNNRE